MYEKDLAFANKQRNSFILLCVMSTNGVMYLVQGEQTYPPCNWRRVLTDNIAVFSLTSVMFMFGSWININYYIFIQ